MLSRQVWSIGAALLMTGQVLAQEVTPAVPTSPPPAAATQPRAATPTPAPVDAKAVQAEATQPAASAAAPNPLEGELDADKIMAMQKAGYTIKNENGQILLCRRDQQTGSRLRHKTSCMTAREWEQLRADNEMQLKAIERRPRMSNQ